MKFQTLNPANGQLLKRYSPANGREIESALARSEKAFAQFRTTSLKHRTECLRKAAEILETRAKEFAHLMAVEVGKPVRQGEAEAVKCATACRYFAEHAEEFLRDDKRKGNAADIFVTYEPIGTILAIMPWNFPFWQFFRFAAPTLAVGNTILLKPAPNTPQCSLAISDVLVQAGFAPDVVQTVFLTNGNAGKVLQDYRVSAVTLTGSTEAGSHVAHIAGKALKPMVLELGGSDPFIVFNDADVKAAAKVGAWARCQNSGQSCIAAKRFLVHRDIMAEFRAAFLAELQSLVVGDPMDERTDIGPLARKDVRLQLQRQVKESVNAGANLILGGKIPKGDGFHYPPTVLEHVPQSCPAWKEELFGPVAVLTPFSSEEEAVCLANDTRYGLGASVWTGNTSRARNLIPRIECGTLFINEMVKSDPAIPFGGVKHSGFGRELAREGMLEFANRKSVWIK